MLRRTFLSVLLAIILMAILSCESPPPSGVTSEWTGKLAVVANLPNTRQVILLDKRKGKKKEDITRLANSSTNPAFDRYGNNLYFTVLAAVGHKEDGTIMMSNQISRLDLKTKETVRLSDKTGNDATPAPNPLKDLVAFASIPLSIKNPKEAHYRIYLMDEDGKNRRLLDPDGPVSQLNPSWSPDGTKLAYLHRTDSTTLMEIALKEKEAKEKAGLDKAEINKQVEACMKLNFRSTLRIYDFDSKTSREILPADFIIGSPSWSPGGDLIAFTFIEKGKKYIYVVKSDGTGLKGITPGPDDDQASWSPDGKKLVFSRGEGDTRIICEVDLETQKVRPLLKKLQVLEDEKYKFQQEQKAHNVKQTHKIREISFEYPAIH